MQMIYDDRTGARRLLDRSRSDDLAEQMTDEPDDLRPARGVLTGVAISAVLWLAVLGVADVLVRIL